MHVCPPLHWFLSFHLLFVCVPSSTSASFADIQSMLNFTLNQVTAFLLSTLSFSTPSLILPSQSLRFWRAATAACPLLPPQPSLNLFSSSAFLLLFSPSRPSIPSSALISPTPRAPFPPLFSPLPPLLISPLPFHPTLSFSSCRLLMFSPFSPSLLKMSFSSWSSLTRNHCVSPAVVGGMWGWWIQRMEGRRAGIGSPMWRDEASKRNERGPWGEKKEKKKNRWKFSPASINHLGEREDEGVCLCGGGNAHAPKEAEMHVPSPTLEHTLQSVAVNKINSLQP